MVPQPIYDVSDLISYNVINLCVFPSTIYVIQGGYLLHIYHVLWKYSNEIQVNSIHILNKFLSR